MSEILEVARVEGKVKALVFVDDYFMTIDDYLPDRFAKFVVTRGAADRGCPQDFEPTQNEDDGTHDFDRDAFAFYEPLYMLDHSGVRISLRDFNDPWDSGQCGMVGALKADVIAEYGDLSEDSIERARLRVESEVSVLSSLFSGEVYGYQIQQFESCKCGESSGWKTVDSVGGFVGPVSDARKEAVSALEDFVSQNHVEGEIEQMN